MKKKFSLLICFILIVSVFVPVIASALAGKPESVPPLLEKRVFIHYRKGYGKPDWTPGQGPPPKEGEGQYDLLGKGVKWKELPASYVIDSNIPGYLTLTFVESAISASAEEWDYWTGQELFDDDYQIVDDGSWDGDAGDYPDGRNELVFGDYPNSGVIAITVVWGYFSGPPGQRRIIEYDILFDTDFTWGYAGPTDETQLGDKSVMDLQNIATHEFGHGIGLDDLYDSGASEETMYGRSEYGETKKRTLYTGDKAGLKELYGE